MGKLLVLLLIILIAFWLGRLSTGNKKEKASKSGPQDESNIIDIELEDKS